MKKVYYDREKDKYIIQRLSLTQIDKVWWPMISDIMLRKQYEYNLSDDILERDLTTFIDNVKEVRANETGTSDGLFYPADRKIEIKKELLDKDKWDPERFYESLTHECMHAINYEKRGEFKQDRTFFAGIFGNKDGAMEIFTESEADALVYNVKNKTNDNYVIQRNTVGYGDITPYIDLISATFGVKRKELLSASIKGKSELDMLLNEHINLPRSNGENEIFKGIELNICILHNILYSEREKNEEDRKLDNENIKMANESIFKTAEKGIYNRLCNIKTEN